MKTKNLIPALLFILMIICISGVSALASNPVQGNSDSIYKMIKESVKYPEHAFERGNTGSVDVTFTLNEDGKIEIEKISTDDKEIAEDVKQQLSKVCCKGIKVPFNQHYIVTFTFKLV